ncbi:hypothetical protein MRB53_035850 [Persea americana]|uniref:Uncharacterized protein n=1 Tax=Persea americana TaxID=3435 RepID=A0ACC2K5S6_PERAE|nr:hypothetical protein MRB53_035850 [Persea americana]
MPLIRFQVRNEFRLGDAELHRGASKEEPKAILDGVAVAGLVGILRQLGDLAEFAADVFHDLHENIMATAARSHRTITRVQRIEAALPSLEKSVLAQTSHIHFAYTPGMLLILKKGSRRRSGELRRAVSISQHYSRLEFVSPDTDERSFAADTVSTSNMRSKSNLSNQSLSFDSELGSNYAERVLDVSSVGAEELEHSKASTSKLETWYNDAHDPIVPDGQSLKGADDDLRYRSLQERAECGTSSVTWDEKTEIVRPISPQVESVSQGGEQAPESMPVSLDQSKLEEGATSFANVDQDDIVFEVENIPQTFSSGKHYEELTSETDNYMDALNNIESEIETDSECQTKRELELQFDFKNSGVEPEAGGTDEVAPQISESYNVESSVASYSSLSKEMDPNSTTSVFSESLTHAQPPQVGIMASTLDCSVNTSLYEDVSRLNGFESVNDHLPTESGISNSHGNKIIDDSCIFQESPKNSDIPSVKFWTNGGLLGLEPSKPPDFVVSNAASQNSAPGSGTGTGTCSLSHHAVMPKLHHDAVEESTTLVQSFEQTEQNSTTQAKREQAASQNSAPGTSTGTGTCNLSHHVVMPKLHHDAVEESTTLVKSFEQTEENSTTLAKREQSPDGISLSDFHNLPPDQFSGRARSVQPEHSTFQHDKRDENMSAKQNSSVSITAVSETQPENLKDLPPSSIFSHTDGVELPAISNTMVQANEVSQNNTALTSGLSGLTQRFLLNGLGRKTSLVHGHSDSSEPASTDPKESQIEQKKWQSGIATQASHGSSPKEQPPLGSSENLTSSPPLEHMKISFHPINGMETSKLKLEFPNGHQFFHESDQDMFPSFQLLPETVEMHDMDSESDDDTFYRSSLYPSDDLLSLRSESSSENWESTEIAGSKDDDIYDALRQVPSAASISGSFGLEGMSDQITNLEYEFIRSNAENGIGTLESGPLPDIPSFDVVNSESSGHQGDSEPTDLLDSALQHPNELPPPPPLPPLQWRMMRHGFVFAEDKQEMISEGDRQLNDMQVEMSDTAQFKLLRPRKPRISDADGQPNDLRVQAAVASFELKRDQPNKTHNEEVTAAPMRLEDSREPNQSFNGKDLDEREDLLHQIRTKSFNLRRTAPTRSSSTASEPTSNVKVSAILEKANAIRQAFAGGDDENWSDG